MLISLCDVFSFAFLFSYYQLNLKIQRRCYKVRNMFPTFLNTSLFNLQFSWIQSKGAKYEWPLVDTILALLQNSDLKWRKQGKQLDHSGMT